MWLITQKGRETKKEDDGSDSVDQARKEKRMDEEVGRELKMAR